MKPKSGKSVGRPRKRKNDSPEEGSEPKRTAVEAVVQDVLSELAESETVVVVNKSGDGRDLDSYCWLCHTVCDVTDEDNDSCFTCPRVYHKGCLNEAHMAFSTEWACPECQLDSVNGLQFPKSVTVERLRKLLASVTFRVDAKKRNYKELFLAWPTEAKVFRTMDLGILMSKINDSVPYTKTAEFFSDVKWIYHNCCVLYDEESEQAKAANLLKKDFMKELLDLEACPECYFHLYCEGSEEDFFIRLCDPPHDIVWAQFSKHPYWPAKCLKVINTTAHVRFFGEHEVSNVPVKKCYFISDSHPKYKKSSLKDKNSALKMPLYKASIQELLQYIQLYESRIGRFKLHPFQSLYKVEISKPQITSQAPVTSKTSKAVSPQSICIDLTAKQSDPSASVASQKKLIKQNDKNANVVIQETSSNVSQPPPGDSTSENTISSSNLPEENIFSESPEDRPTNQHSSVSQSSSTGTSAGQFPQGATELPDENNVQQGEERSTSPEVLETIEIGTEEGDDEDEVEVIEVLEDNVSSDAPQRQRVNPSVVLPYIFDQNRDLHNLFRDGRYILDAMFVELWANASQTPFAPEILMKAISEKKALEAEVTRLQKEKGALEERLQSNAVKYEEDTRKLCQEVKVLSYGFDTEKQKSTMIKNNAREVIEALQKKFNQNLEAHAIENKRKLEENEKLILEKNAEIEKCINEVKREKARYVDLNNEKIRLEEEYKSFMEEFTKDNEKFSLPLEDYFCIQDDDDDKTSDPKEDDDDDDDDDKIRTDKFI